MKRYLSLLSAFLLGTFSFQAQTLEGSFSCQGEETTTSPIQLTAIAGQPLEGTVAGSPLAYGFVEMVSTANEYTNMEALTLNREETTLKIGETLGLSVLFSPKEVENPTVSWHSSNPAVVTVNNGVVSATQAGGAVITAVSACGVYSAECNITVTQSEPDPEPEPDPILVTGVALEPEEVTLEIGGTQELKATVLPQNADDKQVEWSSSDERVATVQDGVVTAISAGTATVCVTTIDGGYEATCWVTVNEDPTSVEPVSEGNCIFFVEGLLHLDLQKPQKVSVWNVSGQMYDTFEGHSGANRFSLQTYPDGIYFVRIGSWVVKIVKR